MEEGGEEEEKEKEKGIPRFKIQGESSFTSLVLYAMLNYSISAPTVSQCGF